MARKDDFYDDEEVGFFEKYKIIILIIIISLIGGVIFFVFFIKNEKFNDIIMPKDIVLYLEQQNEVDVKLSGVKNTKTLKHIVNIADYNVVQLLTSEVNKDNLKLSLSAKMVGKTTLDLQIEADNVTKSKLSNVIVCKVLNQNLFSSNTIYIKPGLSTEMIFDVGMIDECQNELELKSSNNNVAKITKNSLKAQNEGEAIITIKQNDKKEELKIIVSNDIKLIDDINVEITDLTLQAGDEYAIPYEVKSENMLNNYLLWKSNDSEVATVTQKGLIQAKKEGTTDILLSSVDGSNIKKLIKLKVVGGVKEKVEPVQTISLSTNSVKLTEGKSQAIKYTLLPAKASYKTLRFESENKNIAKVDINGKITAVKQGKTKVNVIIENTDGSIIKSSLEVIVEKKKTTEKKYINVEEITITGSYFFNVGESKKLNYTITPSNADISSIEFKSENPEGVSVDKNGVLTAKIGGVTPRITITVTNMDGSKVTQNTRVLVYDKIRVITPSAKNITSTSATVEATFTNTNNYKVDAAEIYLWSSGSKPANPTIQLNNVATTKATFNLKNLSPGITYKYQVNIILGNEIYSSAIKEFTTQSVTSFKFDKTYAAVIQGNTYTLPLNVQPAGTNFKPDYSSSNQTVATVDSNGVVKASKTGETTITATKNGKSSKINIRVVADVSKNKPAYLYDLSEYDDDRNPTINWQAMKKNNMNHVILRLGITSYAETEPYMDYLFDEYVKAARENDIEVGVYYYTRATNVNIAAMEAKYVLNVLSKYPKGTFSLPVFFDFEDPDVGLPYFTGSSGANIINRFCDTIEAGGYYCGVYTWDWLLDTYDGLLSKSVRTNWVADWTQSGSYVKWEDYGYGMWQFGVPFGYSYIPPLQYGLPNYAADTNEMYVNYPYLIINSGFNGFK